MNTKPQKKTVSKTKELPAITPIAEEKKPVKIVLAPNRPSAIPSEVLNRIYDDDDREKELKKLKQLPAPKYKLSASLPSEEWDFRSLRQGSESDREMCLKYELSREVRLWRQMAYNHRRTFEGKSPEEQWNRYYELMILFPCLRIALQFPEWPDTPWLALDPRIRQENLEPRYWESLRADPAIYSEDPPLSKFRRVAKKYGKHIIYTHFEIDLSQHNNTIKTDFSEWIDLSRKQTRIKPSERRGMRSAYDVLKALGAFRLLIAMKGDWKKAAELFLKNDIDSYQDKTAWRDAATRTEEVLAKFSNQEHFLADVSAVLGPNK